ncbi:MAG: VWA domain-containing protein [Bauldia sp.]|nr:VWA domain-containing protein [Bauldia sp.]
MTLREAAGPGLRPAGTGGDASARRLHELVRPREALYAAFRDSWPRIERIGPPAALEAWSAAAAELINAHAGAGTLLAFASITERLGRDLGLDALAAIGREAAEICRHAGRRPAEAALTVLPSLCARGGHAFVADVVDRYRVVTEVARARRGSVLPLLGVMATVGRAMTPTALSAWAAAGLRATATGSAAEAEAYFGLKTPLSRRVLAESGGDGFAARERALSAIFLALWGIRPVIRARDFDGGSAPVPRTGIAGQVIQVPPVPPILPPALAARYYEAALAHVGAHARFTPRKFQAGELKPVSIALVSLVEDARVEALAMREMPGLRRLWGPFHEAAEVEAPSSFGLIARLGRALFHLDRHDDDPWVEKGRRLFIERLDRLEDPAIPREIANLVGNDLGQMRLPFNAKTYLVEPAYRDDNLGLWEFADEPDHPAEAHEVAHDSVRIERKEDPDDPDARGDPDDAEESEGAQSATFAPAGPVIVRYPEWDHAAGVFRPDWVTLREAVPAPAGTSSRYAAADAAVAARIESIVRRAAIGRSVRLRRQSEGEQLDLDAAIDAASDLRRRETPDPRVFQRRAQRHRDLAALLLIDASESTRRLVAGTRSRIIDLEVAAVRLVSGAMAMLGDSHAVWAFRSAGRDEVSIAALKAFAEPAEPAAERFAALEPGLSTRLGAALRHSTAALAGSRSLRRLLLVVTDGQPYDIDVDDPAYLVEDARKAVQMARDRGVDVFCVGLGTEESEAGKRIFGARNYFPVARLSDLPAKLAMLYFRLALR